MIDDVDAGGAKGPNGEPASGPISGSPTFSRPLLPRIKRDSVIAFVNETLDAVELLADRLADVVGLHRGGVSGPPAAPPTPPSSPTPPNPPSAAPPPPPPPFA